MQFDFDKINEMRELEQQLENQKTALLLTMAQLAGKQAYVYELGEERAFHDIKQSVSDAVLNSELSD